MNLTTNDPLNFMIVILQYEKQCILLRKSSTPYFFIKC